MTTETATPGDATPQAGAEQTAATGEQPTAVQGAAAAQPEPKTEAADGGKVEGEGGKQEDTTAKAPEVPEKYDLKAPEGVELDTAAVEEFTAIAKELKLSQDDAQKLAGIAVKMQQRQAEAHVNTVRQWEAESRADKEFGGDAFEPNLAVARKAIDTFGSPALKDMLNATGLGNHPEVLRAFYKAGKAISESTFVQSGARAPTGTRDPAKALYPDMN